MAETYQIIVTEAAKKDINDILDYLQDNVPVRRRLSLRHSSITKNNCNPVR
jgi:plasmid stabilization system protein ParE